MRRVAEDVRRRAAVAPDAHVRLHVPLARARRVHLQDGVHVEAPSARAGRLRVHGNLAVAAQRPIREPRVLALVSACPQHSHFDQAQGRLDDCYAAGRPRASKRARVGSARAAALWHCSMAYW